MLTLWPSSACLVSELARELAALPPEELAASAVVLPTRRLQTWLLALVAKRRAAFIPPQGLTLEDFIRSWAEALNPGGAAVVTPLSELQEELLIADLIKSGGYTHLRLGHAHECRQLFAEFTQWGQLPQAAFLKLHEVLAANVYLSEGGVDSLSGRVQELANLHLRLSAQMQDLGACSAPAALAAASAALAAALASGASLPARHLYVVGLTSAQGMHGALFHALGSRPEARIWLSAPPDDPKSPLALLLKMFGATPVHTSALERSAHGLLVQQEGSVLAEVEQALSLVEEAVRGGLPPSSIALLVTNDASYGKPLRLLLAGSELAANIALGTPLLGTEIGSWLAALLAMLQTDEDLASILAFLSHPLTMAWQGQTSAGWRERLSRELTRLGVDAGFHRIALAPALTPELRATLQDVAATLGPFIGPSPAAGLPLAAWTSALRTLADAAIGGDPGLGQGQSDLAQSSQAQLREFLAALDGATRLLGGPLARSELRELLATHLLTLEVRSVGDPLKGLQVLSLAEARYVPFELAIVLGAVEGDFPRALPKDNLVDNYLKTRIGLPGWHLLEAIEDSTFALLRARLPRLVLSYPGVAFGEPAVRSRFIEAALARGDAAAPALPDGTASALAVARRLAARGKAAVRDPGGPCVTSRAGASAVVPEAERARLLAAFSASSLEALVRCPYRFLLQRLGVDATELIKDDDARAEGDWLHDVLEAFFTGKAGERMLMGPLEIPNAPLRGAGDDGEVAGDGVADAAFWYEFRSYALTRLGALTEALAPAGLASAPVLLQLELRSWPAFVEHLRRLYTPATLARALGGFRERPLTTDDGTPVELQVGARRLKLRGAVDAIEKASGLHVVTDYKRAGTPPKNEVTSGIAPQLLVYAQAAASMDPDLPLGQAVCGYWSILKGTWHEGVTGSAAAPHAKAIGLATSRDGGLEEAVADFLGHVAWRLDEVEPAGAAFRPDPSACGFCRFGGVCRKDDPELGAAVTASARLADRLASAGEASE